MDFFKLLRKENIELVIIAIVFVVLFYFVLRDFKLTSSKSWGLLLGLTALGGIVAIRAIARRRLLNELEDREKELEEIEKRYKEMRDNNKILEDDYQRLKSELDQARQDSYNAIMASDKRLEDARRNVLNNENVTKEELVNFLKTY